MSFPCHVEVIHSKKEQTVPKPKEEVAQKKAIPEETEEMKTYGPWINSA